MDVRTWKRVLGKEDTVNQMQNSQIGDVLLNTNGHYLQSCF